MCYISLKTKDLAALLPEISSGCNFFLSCVEQSQPHDFFFLQKTLSTAFLALDHWFSLNFILKSSGKSKFERHLLVFPV